MDAAWIRTSCTESNEGVCVFPQGVPDVQVDRQLRQEVLYEVMRCHRGQVPLQLVQDQHLHML